jgi:hypothetical protein
MAWYKDLSPCDYFGAEAAARLQAVGWLQRGSDYPIEPISRRVFDQLREFAKAPWVPMAFAGLHACDLCLYEGEAQGSTNLFVPGNGVLYVCPELIIHYMNAHAYAPPELFCEAVLSCPPMRSMKYFRAILANGGRPFLGEAIR